MIHPTRPTIAAPHPGGAARRSPTVVRVAVLIVAAVALAACGSDDSGAEATNATSNGSDASTPAPDGDELFPDVVEVEVTAAGGGDFEVAATVSSPYDSPERYADAWRVLDADGNELGVRELGHDHASEQPFTRMVTVAIPAEVDEITVEGRDQESGYGGATATATATVPHDG